MFDTYDLERGRGWEASDEMVKQEASEHYHGDWVTYDDATAAVRLAAREAYRKAFTHVTGMACPYSDLMTDGLVQS